MMRVKLTNGDRVVCFAFALFFLGISTTLALLTAGLAAAGDVPLLLRVLVCLGSLGAVGLGVCGCFCSVRDLYRGEFRF